MSYMRTMLPTDALWFDIWFFCSPIKRLVCIVYIVHSPVQAHKKCYTYNSKVHLIIFFFLKSIFSKNAQLIDKTIFFFTASELQSMQVECNSLQKECSVLRSEKQDIVNKHQKERSSLQTECASLRAEKEELLKTHQKEKGNMQSECAAVRSEKEVLLQKQKQLEKDLARSVHWDTLSRVQLQPHLLCTLCPIWLCSNCFATQYTTHLLPDPSPIELSVILFLLVHVLRILSWAIVSKP